MFSDQFKGLPIITVELSLSENNFGKLHPMKAGKIFFQ